MPTTMKTHHGGPSEHKTFERTPVQKFCIFLGGALIGIGVLGVMMPGLMGMHLSMVHNLIHIITGVLAIIAGISGVARSLSYCLIFGSVYTFLGILGFLFGRPGYPAVGHMEADQHLLRMIPSFLELGTVDHVVHMIIGLFLLFTAYTFRKERRTRSI